MSTRIRIPQIQNGENLRFRQSQLRTENPPTNPTQPPKQALTVRQAVVLSARATTGKPGHSTITIKNYLERLSMCSVMSDFIETNDFNKFSLDLNLEGRRWFGFFPFFRKLSAILDFYIFSRDLRPVLSNPKIS